MTIPTTRKSNFFRKCLPRTLRYGSDIEDASWLISDEALAFCNRLAADMSEASRHTYAMQVYSVC